MIKIAMAGILIVLISIQLKTAKHEYGILMAVAGCTLLLTLSVDRLSEMFLFIKRITNYIKVDEGYISTLLKIVGITYISEFAADLCRDSGHGSIGNQIELGAKLSILILSMPIFLSLLDTIDAFRI